MGSPAARDLRVGLEAGYDPGWPAGLLYVRNLVYALTSLPDDQRPYIRLLPVTSETIRRIEDLRSLGGVQIAAPTRAAFVGPSLIARRLRRRFLQPWTGRILDEAFEGLDVTFPSFGRPLPGTPQIGWIPDLQHAHLPHLFSQKEIADRDARFRSMAYGSNFIILSSESARRDLAQLFPDMTAPTRVWHFRSTFTDSEMNGRNPHDAYGLPEHYLYVANQFWKHKDHLTLFRALVLLRQAGVKPHVVCTGRPEDPRDPAYADEVMSFLESSSLLDQVTLLGEIPRPDQIQVLRYCAAVVQPSRFEGWSTVIEDARAMGRPVIASDIDVHKEQVPEARFFSAGSPDALAETIAADIDRFPAGPDLEGEREAAAMAGTRRVEAGRSFVSIAEEAAVS